MAKNAFSKILAAREVYFRWLGIPVVGLIMAFVHGRAEGQSFAEKWFTATVFTAVFWNGAFAIFIAFRKRFPRIKQTPKRLSLTFLALVGFMILADPLLCLTFGMKDLQTLLQPGLFFENLGINILTACIVGSIYENAFFFHQWRNTIKLNEALKNQQVRTQYEVLQNQMSPHFLFNSLNTLATIIPETPELATRFTEKLSEVYRYILNHRESELVSGFDELRFVENYIFLLQIRYPENLKVDISVKGDESWHIPPLTLQMLVENAVKHNTISRNKPLSISISEDGEKIWVKNNLQPKNTPEKSTKTGLENVRKRYAYFGDKSLEIVESESQFLVSVPMLQVRDMEKLNEPVL